MSNLRLVINSAKHFRRRGFPFSDLIQEGNLALIKAAQEYDPETGYRFCTYAIECIKGTIKNALARKSRIIRIPKRSSVKTSNNYLPLEDSVLYKISAEIEKERKNRKELEIDFTYLLASLTNREREIIKLRYGFYDEEHTLEEIGTLLNLSKEGVRLIENKALKKLRRQINIREK